MNRGRKVIYNIRNYCKIKIIEDSIEQKQFVNSPICKKEITALKKSQILYMFFMITDNFILK